MNKKDLVELVATEMSSPKAEAEKALNAVIESIKKGLKENGSVQLIGFGSFAIKERKAREGRNPKTGEVIKIKASKTVSFKPGKNLKETI